MHCAQAVHLTTLATCHAITCKYGGDVVSQHNRIRDILVETCRQAHIRVKVEVGNNLSLNHSKTRLADIPLDVLSTSPLLSGVSARAAARPVEHQANDPKCSELGWVCVPIRVSSIAL